MQTSISFLHLNVQNSRNSFMDLAKKEGEQLSQGSYEEDIQKMDNEKTIEYRQFLSSVGIVYKILV